MDEDGLMTKAFEPDYEGECQCGRSPTVVLIDGDASHDSGLCGLCFFGTAKALDVDWWTEFENA